MTDGQIITSLLGVAVQAIVGIFVQNKISRKNLTQQKELALKNNEIMELSSNRSVANFVANKKYDWAEVFKSKVSDYLEMCYSSVNYINFFLSSRKDLISGRCITEDEFVEALEKHRSMRNAVNRIKIDILILLPDDEGDFTSIKIKVVNLFALVDYENTNSGISHENWEDYDGSEIDSLINEIINASNHIYKKIIEEASYNIAYPDDLMNSIGEIYMKK